MAKPHREPAGRARSYQPRLEQLEDRQVLSASPSLPDLAVAALGPEPGAALDPARLAIDLLAVLKSPDKADPGTGPSGAVNSVLARLGDHLLQYDAHSSDTAAVNLAGAGGDFNPKVFLEVGWQILEKVVGRFDGEAVPGSLQTSDNLGGGRVAGLKIMDMLNPRPPGPGTPLPADLEPLEEALKEYAGMLRSFGAAKLALASQEGPGQADRTGAAPLVNEPDAPRNGPSPVTFDKSAVSLPSEDGSSSSARSPYLVPPTLGFGFPAALEGNLLGPGAEADSENPAGPGSPDKNPGPLPLAKAIAVAEGPALAAPDLGSLFSTPSETFLTSFVPLGPELIDQFVDRVLDQVDLLGGELGNWLGAESETFPWLLVAVGGTGVSALALRQWQKRRAARRAAAQAGVGDPAACAS
jgi:hypothetical protein